MNGRCLPAEGVTDIQGEGEGSDQEYLALKGNAMCSHDATHQRRLAWQLGAECERGADQRAVQGPARAGPAVQLHGSIFVPSNAIDNGFDLISSYQAPLGPDGGAVPFLGRVFVQWISAIAHEPYTLTRS